jgi:hypothetical protein
MHDLVRQVSKSGLDLNEVFSQTRCPHGGDPPRGQILHSGDQVIERAEHAQHREFTGDPHPAQFREPQVIPYPLAEFLFLIGSDAVNPIVSLDVV